jgi:membrane protease YdiL (CAAX protease family)
MSHPRATVVAVPSLDKEPGVIEPPAPLAGQSPAGAAADVPARVPWRWWEALAVFAVTFVVSGIAVAVAAMSLSAPAALTLSLPALFVVLIVATLGYVRLRYPRALRLLFGPRRPGVGDLAVAIGFGFGGFLVINLLLSLALDTIAHTTGLELPEVQAELRRLALNADTAPILFVSAVLLAPLAEELFFRGMLFQSLRTHHGLRLGMILSAAAFSLAHLEPSVLATVLVTASIFPLGLLLAWLLARRGTLAVPVVVHGVFNLLGVAAIWVGLD